MSAKDKSLVPCENCAMGYEFKLLYDVEGADGEPAWICGPCYDKWVYGKNPWRDENGEPV